MNNKDQFDKVGEAWAMDHPCNNDTTFIRSGRDTIIEFSDYTPDFVGDSTNNGDEVTNWNFYHDTIYMTRTKTVRVRDSVISYTRDPRYEDALRKQMNRCRDSLNAAIISAAKYKAASTARGWIIGVIGVMSLLLLVAGFFIGKFFKRLNNENAALRQVHP